MSMDPYRNVCPNCQDKNLKIAELTHAVGEAKKDRQKEIDALRENRDVWRERYEWRHTEVTLFGLLWRLCILGALVSFIGFALTSARDFRFLYLGGVLVVGSILGAIVNSAVKDSMEEASRDERKLRDKLRGELKYEIHEEMKRETAK